MSSAPSSSSPRRKVVVKQEDAPGEVAPDPEDPLGGSEVVPSIAPVAVGSKRHSNGTAVKKEVPLAITAEGLAELVRQREAIHSRLLELTGIEAEAANATGILTMTAASVENKWKDAPPPDGQPKKALHWDHVMKEMVS